jgi:outer membrane lipoprotein-sorting protein
MRSFRLVLLVVAVMLCSVMTGHAQDLTPAQSKQAITQIEKYFNAVTTVRARFAQANQDGTILKGVFTWWRPGRLRFQYDPPNGDYIVSDGLLLHYWDDAVKNYSNAPIGSTLADFLLRKEIKLSGDLKVVSVRRPAPNRLLVTMIQTENPEAGDLRLLFREKPLQLYKWRVTDGMGQVTETSLTQIETGIKLDPRLFRFIPPKGYDQDWKNR